MRHAAAANPYGKSRLGDNLKLRVNGVTSAGFGGNNTASQVLFRSSYTVPKDNAAKRRKTIPREEESKYFAEGASGTRPRTAKSNGTGAGTSTGKGKGRQSISGEQTLSSDDEDRGELYPRRSESPDPLNCIGPSTSSPRRESSPHDFDKPSRRGPNRLPQDGSSTRTLRERLQQSQPAPSEATGEVIDLASDDIESASGFDVEEQPPPQKRLMTPNGRSQIPKGNVSSKIQAFEGKPPPTKLNPLNIMSVASSKQSQQSNSKEEAPFVVFKQQPPRRVLGMKPKGAAKTPPQLSLGIFGRTGSQSSGLQLDSVETSSSGFKKNTEPLARLPLEAWALGCHIFTSDDEMTPVHWLGIHRKAEKGPYELQIFTKPEDKTAAYSFSLDRDFVSLQYPDSSLQLSKEVPPVIQLRTSPSAKVKLKTDAFQPGASHMRGRITFKFLIRHANWNNGTEFTEIVNILRQQIKDKEAKQSNRHPARCWQEVKNAVEMFATRSEIPSTRHSSASVAPTHESSSTVVPSSERSSVSAPPSRSYGSSAERRVTRQSTRIARKSPSPDLDELILVYPFSGTGAVNITRGDVKRLDPGQYLNDTIIEFGLKVWLEELRGTNPALAEQVHVFNSFFYKKLNSSKNLESTYNSVRKWTSKVDIFRKKYIIVPINENFHWYVVIIENPANMLHPRLPPPPTPPRETRKRKRDSTAAAAAAAAAAEEKQDTTAAAAPAKSRSPPAHIPDAMAIDVADSEGDGREVENMLDMSQCSIVEVPQTSKRGEGAKSPSNELANAELQYPMSEEAMEVDSGPEVNAGAQSADNGRSRSASEVITIDDDDEKEKEERESKPASSKTSAEPFQEVDGSTKHTAEQASTSGEAGGTPPVEAGAMDSICYIYTFDSLGGRHTPVAIRLSKYLQQEAVDKKQWRIEDTCPATPKAAKTPLQLNYCDCGLFVLSFVEHFMKDPIAASEMIRRSEMDWFPKGTEELPLREIFRNKTLECCEEWRKYRAAKEDVKEGSSGVTRETEGKNAKDKARSEAIEDDDDDEVVMGEIKPAPKSRANRGRQKALRLR